MTDTTERLIRAMAAKDGEDPIENWDHYKPYAEAAMETFFPQSFRAGQTVECIDAWDTFNNLTVGKTYQVLEVRDGFVFVRGNAGFVGGWAPSHFAATSAKDSGEPS